MKNSIRSAAMMVLPLAASLAAHAQEPASPAQDPAAVTQSVDAAPITAQPADAAPTDLTDLNLEDLMNVQVTTASKKAQSLNSVPAAIYVVTQEDIRRSGAKNIPEALRLAPGVEVDQIDAEQYAVSIRGFNSRYSDKLLVLIDGRSIYSNVSGGVYWEDQRMPMADIDRIEIIRGPGGSLWGSNAVNGIVNIITKNAKDTLGGLVTAEAGTNAAGRQVTARYGAKTGKNGFYRISAMGLHEGYSYRVNGQSAGDESDGGRVSLRYDVGDEKTGKGLVEADAYSFDDHARDYFPIVVPPYSTTREGSQPVRGASVLGKWDKQHNDGSVSSYQIFFTHEDRQMFDVKQTRDVYDLDFQQQMAARGRHNVILGMGYRYNPVDNPLANQRYTPQGTTDRIFSAFFQDEVALRQKLHLTLGAKVENNNYTGWEYEPNLRLGYTPDEKHTTWFSVARAVRTPGIAERNVDFNIAVLPAAGPTPTLVEDILGDPHNKSEIEVSGEIGSRAQISSRVLIDAAAFYSAYDNSSATRVETPIVVTSPSVYVIVPVRLVNTASAHTYGVELTSRIKATDNWRLDLSYSYLDGDTSGKSRGIGAAKNQYQIRSYKSLTPKLDFDTALYYSGNGVDAALPTYSKLDVRLAYRPSKAVEISVGGRNLLKGRQAQMGLVDSFVSNLIGSEYYGSVSCKF